MCHLTAIPQKGRAEALAGMPPVHPHFGYWNGSADATRTGRQCVKSGFICRFPTLITMLLIEIPEMRLRYDRLSSLSS